MIKLKLILAFIVFTHNAFAQDAFTSEDLLVMNDSIQLPGTLTFNPKLKSQPLVIFVHGSGNVDRNGNQAMMNANANYIKMLNDSLVSKGIAFYRFDKRTATQSNIKFIMTDMIFDRFVEDINHIINRFKDDKRFSSISLIGHSQGSLVAMLVDHTHIDKYISIAGPSNSIDKIMVEQVRFQNGDSLASKVDSHFKELAEKGSIENVNPMLISLFNKPTQPFMLSWMAYNPAEEIKKLKLPILILNGSKDIQVATTEAENLHQANPKSELVIIDNMNHVLKTIEKDEDNMASYMSPDFKLSQELVEVIETFIKK
ncbi:alpha/beta hydrolase family protein [Psychroserpens sp.]|uniref:alpha/beta hydrolase family protein n=1 Tax=Psychroserpens sp. TaxID=2020870 RepID=UPI002B2718AE|nr:alpha/beta hydrolase [Psychroserpens sp.]